MVTELDTGDKESPVELEYYDIIGWKTIGLTTYPVPIGLNAESEAREITQSRLYNTTTGEYSYRRCDKMNVHKTKDALLESLLKGRSR